MDNFKAYVIMALLSLNIGMTIAVSEAFVDLAEKDYRQAYDNGARDMYQYLKTNEKP